jgi:hypothetical protein
MKIKEYIGQNENNDFIFIVEEEKDSLMRIVVEASSKEEAETKIKNLRFDSEIEITKSNLLSQVRYNASKLLSETDYKVLRHLGQKELSSKGKLAKTKLSDKQYENLELEREAIRKWSNDKEVEINNATTIEELEQIRVEYSNV